MCNHEFITFPAHDVFQLLNLLLDSALRWVTTLPFGTSMSYPSNPSPIAFISNKLHKLPYNELDFPVSLGKNGVNQRGIMVGFPRG